MNSWQMCRHCRWPPPAPSLPSSAALGRGTIYTDRHDQCPLHWPTWQICTPNCPTYGRHCQSITSLLSLDKGPECFSSEHLGPQTTPGRCSEQAHGCEVSAITCPDLLELAQQGEVGKRPIHCFIGRGIHSVTMQGPEASKISISRYSWLAVTR